MEKDVSDQRDFERYDVNFPGRLASKEEGGSLTIQTRDISASGAYLQTDAAFTEGAEVDVEIILDKVSDYPGNL